MVRLRHASGFTFVELVIFIVVSSVALVGVLALYQQATAKAADTIVSRQAREAAHELLEEIQSMPFTFCVTSDPAASTAGSTAGCNTVQVLSPVAGKSRGSLTNPFTNVGDYGGYSRVGIVDIAGGALPGLSAYTISVALSQPALTGIPSSELIRIDVAVSGPYGPLTVSGYRLRHSPNALP